MSSESPLQNKGELPKLSSELGDLSIDTLSFEKITVDDPGKPFDQLFAELHAASKLSTKRGRARRTEYKLWTKPEASIYGWKFDEWDYGRDSVVLPSYARGLFSIIEDGKERIAVRGYNKFFNINEVHNTNWKWIEKNTKGPYEVTSKENGCILFISGLADGTLIVTSKQATGPRDTPNEKNHSWVGQKWVERHLATKNIPVTKFAQLLHSMGATAVGELCDDDFEEHVLAYPGDKAGIYLHGLNLNVAKFTTYPFSSIERFASQFGFHTTDYVVKDTVAELRTFLETCAETGSWNGLEVEGFVIRSKAKLEPQDSVYSDFFFKYKFEEPYLMYRQWREISRAYLSGKPRDQIRINKHQEISNRYLDFVIPLFNKDPNLREAYNASHGIIAIREQFLAFMGKSGASLIQDEPTVLPSSSDVRRKKYVLVPVSTIGCGKTTVAVALTHLFPSWGHFQNDDLTTGPKPQRLVQRCLDYLTVEDVVFLDRNNHQFRERAQIFTDFPKLTRFADYEYVYICLDFNPFDTPNSSTWNLTTSRVLKRGDNHQSIHASSDSNQKIMSILSGFKGRYQPVVSQKSPDDNFDFIIELDSTKENSSRINLEKIVKALHEKYPDIVPEAISKERFDAAYEFSLAYVPKASGPSKSHYEKETKKGVMKPSYFGIAVDFSSGQDQETSQQTQLISLIDRFFASNSDIEQPAIWAELKEGNRVQQAFHVTLVHAKQGGSKSLDLVAKDAFTRYSALYKTISASAPVVPQTVNNNKKSEGNGDGFKTVEKKGKGQAHVPVSLGLSVDIRLKSLAWTNDLMVFEIEVLDNQVKEESILSSSVPAIASVNKVPHITVGTHNSSIPAVRAGEALAGTSSKVEGGKNNKKGKKNNDKLVKVSWNVDPLVLKDQEVMAFP